MSTPTNKECGVCLGHGNAPCGHAPTQPEKCCKNGLKKAGAGTIPCFKDHTPESKWEERFDDKFGDFYYPGITSPSFGAKDIKSFIRTLVEEVKCKHEK